MWYFLIEHLRTAFRWFLSFFIFIEEYSQPSCGKIYRCYNFWPFGSVPQMLLYEYFNLTKSDPGIDILAWHRFLAKRYGVAIIHSPVAIGINFVAVYNPADIRHVLKNNENNYERNLFFPAVKRLLGSGISATNGHEWIVQRKTALSVVSPKLIQESEPVFRVESLNLIDRMTGTFDFQRLIAVYTIIVFSRHAFNYRGNWENMETFAQAFSQVADIVAEMNQRSIVNPLWLMYYACCTPSKFDRAYDRLMSMLKSFLSQVNSNDTDHYSILAKYKDKNEYNESQIADIMLNLLIAGRDTLAYTLTATIYLLARHPEVETRLVDEIYSSFDNSNNINMKITDKMPYLSNIISEVLRLYPSVGLDIRMAKHGDVLPSNGYHVRPKDVVVVSSFGTHRSEMYWGKDSEVFNPDRWGKGRPPNVQPEGVDEGAYFPFHYGSHQCVGMRLSYAELKYTLVMLYYHLHFDLVDPGPHQVEHKLTGSFIDGLMVSSTARNRDSNQ